MGEAQSCKALASSFSQALVEGRFSLFLSLKKWSGGGRPIQLVVLLECLFGKAELPPAVPNNSEVEKRQNAEVYSNTDQCFFPDRK